MTSDEKKKYLKLFLEFMKMNHCLKKFLYNCFKQKNRNIHNISDLEEYFEYQQYTPQIINFSFTWMETKEGHDYWEKLNNKLFKILNEIE